MKKKLVVLSGFVLGFAPILAFAQNVTCRAGSSGNLDLLNVICRINQILATIVPVLVALGVVYFIWGVISYVIASDEESKKKGRDKIIYGIIGLTVIVALWGLVGILQRTFGVENPSRVVPPVVPF